MTDDKTTDGTLSHDGILVTNDAPQSKITVDESGTIIDGHARAAALADMGALTENAIERPPAVVDTDKLAAAVAAVAPVEPRIAPGSLADRALRTILHEHDLDALLDGQPLADERDASECIACVASTWGAQSKRTPEDAVSDVMSVLGIEVSDDGEVIAGGERIAALGLKFDVVSESPDLHIFHEQASAARDLLRDLDEQRDVLRETTLLLISTRRQEAKARRDRDGVLMLERTYRNALIAECWAKEPKDNPLAGKNEDERKVKLAAFQQNDPNWVASLSRERAVTEAAEKALDNLRDAETQHSTQRLLAELLMKTADVVIHAAADS